MRNWRVEHWTGAAGIAGAVMQVVAYAVFIFIAGAPRDTETTLTAFLHRENTPIQTSLLLFFVAFAVWFVFFAGLRTLIAEASPKLEYLGTTVFGLGVALMVLGLIFLGMEAAATATAFSRPDRQPDNSVIYALFMGGSVLNGAPSGVLVVVLLAVSGWALWRSRLLSGWSAWLSWIIAILVAATLPALYQGDDLHGNYSADGGVVDVLVFVPLYIWAIAVSIAILRRPAAP